MSVGGEDGGVTTVNCSTYEWSGKFDAMHKVWVSKASGLVVKELQRQEGGPNPYPAAAEVQIAYDVVLPEDMFSDGSSSPSYPTTPEVFAPPAACSKSATCSPKNEHDCRETRCCADAGYTCYKKNDHWASCLQSCTPGMRDGHDHHAWDCADLTQTTLKANAASLVALARDFAPNAGTSAGKRAYSFASLAAFAAIASVAAAAGLWRLRNAAQDCPDSDHLLVE